MLQVVAYHLWLQIEMTSHSLVHLAIEREMSHQHKWHPRRCCLASRVLSLSLRSQALSKQACSVSACRIRRSIMTYTPVKFFAGEGRCLWAALAARMGADLSANLGTRLYTQHTAVEIMTVRELFQASLTRDVCPCLPPCLPWTGHCSSPWAANAFTD